MVLVEGQNGDGATIDEDNFDVTSDSEATLAADQVISAILGTREGAAEGGYQLASTGVTWTDPIEAAALRDALAARKIENVMLVSAFLAAAALAHAVGNETKYAQTALLFIEPDTATLAVVDTVDGSIADVHRQALPADDDAAVDQLTSLVASAEELETRPDGVFVVGSGIDIPMIKPALEAATSLPLTAPEEPETALARGAALASAHAPLFASSTAARAYALDPGTGAIDATALALRYFDVPAGAGDNSLAYSAVGDDITDDYLGGDIEDVVVDPGHGDRRSFTLIGSALGSIFIVGVAALVISLAVSIRPTAGVQPDPGQNVVAPAHPAPEAPALQAPAPAQQAPAPVAVPEAPAPVPQAPAPVAVPQAPAPVDVPIPQAPAPAPIPVPVAPAPAPVAPIPVPIPIPLPGIFSPQLPFGPGIGGDGRGGDDGRGGGHGGFGGGGGHGGFGGGHGGFGGGGGHGRH